LSEKRRELALRMGGVGLCTLMFGETKVREDTNSEGSLITPPPILIQGAGFSATLDFIVRLSMKHDDFLLNELLSLMPSLKTTGDFLDRMETHKISQQEFEYLVELGHLF
jgi:hypothetical protein